VGAHRHGSPVSIDVFYSQPCAANQASGSRRPAILRFFVPLASGAGHLRKFINPQSRANGWQVFISGRAVSYFYRWADEALIARLYEQGSFPDYLFSKEFSIIFLCFILQAASETYRVEKCLFLSGNFYFVILDWSRIRALPNMRLLMDGDSPGRGS
jgi:hypothetical protein